MVEDFSSIGTRIRFAIADRRLVEVRYGRALRVAEPHDYGVLNRRERLLVYQLRGPARPGQESIGWRLLDVLKVEEFTVLEESFSGSRGKSHHNHHAWDILFARVE
jgi:hypothetical protein